MTRPHKDFSYDRRLVPRQIVRPLLRWRAHNLVCRERRILIGFTPKAGCSFASKVFFHNAAQHNEDRYLEWPHTYRIEYQYQRPVRLADWFNRGITKIKFVRNPFARAVSGYFQAMRTRLNPAIASSVGQERVNWCFEEYLDWLSQTHLDLTNPHFCPQKYWGEGRLFRYDLCIKIEEAIDGLQLADGRLLRMPCHLNHSKHHAQRKPRPGYAGATVYSALKDHEHSFPDWISFYNNDSVKRVVDFYRRDFAEYGYALDPSY